MGLSWGNQAQAYIPPTAFIVKKMAAKHDDFKGVRVRSQVVSLEPGKTGEHFREVALYDAARGVLRSRALDDSGKELFAIERNLNQAASAKALEDAPAGTLMSILLFSANPALDSRALTHFGVPIRTEAQIEAGQTEATSIARFQNLICWLIGEASGSQLWVQKDSFLPVRLKIRGAGDSNGDIQFDSYRFVKEYPYPKQIAISRGDGQSILRNELTELSVNPDLAEFKAPLASGFTDEGNEASSELRELIRTYYQFIR